MSRVTAYFGFLVFAFVSLASATSLNGTLAADIGNDGRVYGKNLIGNEYWGQPGESSLERIATSFAFTRDLKDSGGPGTYSFMGNSALLGYIWAVTGSIQNAVPEPATLVLMGLGLVALGTLRKIRRKS
jgi:hypothetical protein